MVALLVSILSFTSQDGLTVRYSHRHLPVHGTLYKGELYGFFGKAGSDFPLDAIPVPNPPKERSKFYYLLWGQISFSSNYRHRITKDAVWISTGYVALMRFGHGDFDVPMPGKEEPDLKKHFDKAEAHQIEMVTLFEKYGKLRLPISGYAKDVLGFGIIPTSDTSCKCYFLTTQQPEIELWDTRFSWDDKKRKWKTTEDGKNLEKIQSLFAEDFYLFLRKDDYYFVTESGKLFHAAPPKKGEKSRTMKVLWEDAKRPIVAVIEDADNDKVWLFAKDKNAGAKLDLYFEMKDTIRTETFDPTKLRPVNVEGRAKTLLEYLPLISADPKK